ALRSADGAVHRGDDRLERSGGDRGVDAHSPDHLVAHLALHVGRCGRVPTLGQGVLGVVQHGDLHTQLVQRLGERRDRPVAAGLDGVLGALVNDGGGEHVVTAVTGGGHLGGVQLEPAPRGEPVVAGGGQVLVGEDVPQPFGTHLAAVGVGVPLHGAGALDLQPARQVQVPGGGEQVGHPALAGLGVHPDHGLVAAPYVTRVDRQVGHVPDHVRLVTTGLGHLLLADGEALLDRVLVGAGERGVGQVAAVGVAGVHVHLGAVLHRAAHLVDVGEVDARVHTLGVQVHPQGDQVHVAGALTLPEQAALDPVGPGHHGQLGGGHGSAAVVVRVHRQRHVLPAGEVAAHPLDLV